jgi:hypothetical protein
MGAYGGPDIITDGLVLCLDAGSERSYPGSGTTWKDLTATGINGTLTNGPTFNSSNGGSFLFDNVDDYVSLGASSQLPITNQISVFSWVKVDTFSAWDGVFGAYSVGAFVHFQLYYGRLSVYVYGPNAGYGSLDSGYDQLTAGEWSNIGFTFGSQTLTVYLNGVAMPTTVTGSSANIAGTSEMSIGRVYSGSRYLGGNLSNTMVYNKALSQAEISQNYNAQKNRFI